MAIGKDNATWKVILAIFQVVVLVGLPLIGWNAARTINHDARLTALETNDRWIRDALQNLDNRIKDNALLLRQNNELLSRLDQRLEK